jgi:serine/threonine protein kinase
LYFFLDKIKKKIGGGSYGNVYEVENSTGKIFAMKIIEFSSEKKENTEHLKSAKREISIKELSSKSKYLVEIFEYFVENNCYYLIMEFCNNGDLNKFLRDKKKLSLKVFLYFFLFLNNIILFRKF